MKKGLTKAETFAKPEHFIAAKIQKQLLTPGDQSGYSLTERMGQKFAV
jgi:hypothetical protein